MKRKTLSLPSKIALIAAALGILFVLIGIARGVVPLRLPSILMALLIGGGSWGIVAWTIASAAFAVEQDLTAANDDPES